MRADLRLRRANLRPERADFRPEKADSRSERADLRPERTDLGPERGLGGGTYVRKDGRLEIHPCVLQDIGPLGPLPCSHSSTSLDHCKQGIGYR